MKIKNILAIGMLSLLPAMANAETLGETYNEITKLSVATQTYEIYDNTVTDGWINAIPVDDVQYTIIRHEAGDQPMKSYNSEVMEIVGRIPTDKLVISGANPENEIYIYSSPSEGNTSEILIIVEQLWQKKGFIIYGKVNPLIANALSKSQVQFTTDHQVIVNAPIIGFK